MLGGGEDGRRSDRQEVRHAGDSTGRGADANSTSKESSRGRFRPRATDLPVSPLMVYVSEGSRADYSFSKQRVPPWSMRPATTDPQDRRGGDRNGKGWQGCEACWAHRVHWLHQPNILFQDAPGLNQAWSPRMKD